MGAPCLMLMSNDSTNNLKIPKHIAIIMDGNGRWAKSHGLPRNIGHVQGAKNVENICRVAGEMGIDYITFYAFSSENWKRPDAEVKKLMNLFVEYTKKAVKICKKNNVRMLVIGDRNSLGDKLVENIRIAEESSKDNTGLTMIIAMNYGSRDEIVHAVNRIVEDRETGRIEKNDITEDMFSSYLYTAGIPDPDLLIRTSGEMRLSNYLLWQLSYAELYFTDVPWPAFTSKDLENAIKEYSRRDRRFGNITEESK